MYKIILFVLLFPFIVLGNEKVVLQLKWFHQFQFAGYYAAKEKGFYNEVGLDVEIRQRDLKYNNIKQVIEGKAHYGISDSVLFLYKANNEPVVLIAPIFQHSPSILVYLKNNRNISSVYDLDDKDMAFYSNDTDGFSILAMLKKLNIRPNIIRGREKNDYKKLITKEIEVFPAYISNEPFFFKEKNVEIQTIDPKNYGFDLYGDILFTNNNEAKNHPNRVEKFKKATLKGWEYALNNKEEIIQLIRTKYNKSKSIEHLRFEANAIEKIINRDSIPLGRVDEGRIKYIHQLYKEYGLSESNIDVKDFIFGEYNKSSFSNEEAKYLINKKELKMCIDPFWMPYEKNENGKHIGITSDFIKLFNKQLSIPIRFIPTKNWDQTMKYGKERKCDFITIVADTKERKKYFNFSKPYLRTPLVIATKINEPFIDDLSSVIDKKFGIVKGYAYKEVLKRKYPDIKIVDVLNTDDGLKKVGRGELFGFIDSLPVVGYEIQNNYSGDLKVTGKIESWSFSIATRNDEPLLNGIFNKLINSVPPEEHNNILNKWISIKYQQSIDYSKIVWMSVIFLIILIIIIYKNRSINELNSKMQKYIDVVDENILTSSTDIHGNITSASKAFCEMSGYVKNELLGQNHRIIRHPDMSDKLFVNLWSTISSGKVWRGEIKNRKKDGGFYWVYATISPDFNNAGEIIGYTSLRQNITDKKKIEEISITDELTTLYNKRYFNEMFIHEINRAKRDERTFGFLIFDIDHFKQYNDNYGHQKGDEVLENVGKCIQKVCRRSSDIPFRIGGEEFAIVFSPHFKEVAIEFAEKVRIHIEELQIKHKYNSASEYVTVSVGLYVARAEKIKNSKEIYKLSDDALYKAKAKGRNCVVEVK